MTRSRDADRYRDEATHFRQRATSVPDDPELRDRYIALAIQYDRLADLLEGKPQPAQSAPPIPLGSQREAVSQLAADYVRQLGPGAVTHLRDLESAAEANGDQLSAETWRKIAEAAERILASAQENKPDK